MTQEDVDFTTELEQYLDQHDYDMPKSGDIRKGVIVAKSPEGIIVDLGLKRDGIVPPADLAKLSEAELDALEADMEVPVYILDTGQQDGLQVSIHRAYLNEDWINAEEVMAQGTIVEAEVAGYNRGGALVDYGRLRGFVPLSQLTAFRPGMKDRDKQRMLSKLRGEQLPLKIIEVDRRRRRLVMSNRDAQKEWDAERRGERLKTLQAGDTVEGRVSSVRDFGVFVDIGDSLEGLVHVSELAWHRIDHPKSAVKVGDEFEVYILKIDQESQKISLSRKRLLPDPWTQMESKYKTNDLVEGTITRIVNYGAFVEIEPGVEGLLHASKMVRGSDAADPTRVVAVGEKHLLRIINMDSERQRIALSLRAVTNKEQIDWMMQVSQEVDDSETEEDADADVDTEDAAVAESTEEVVATTDTEEATEAEAPAVEEATEAEAPVAEVAAEAEAPVAEVAAEVETPVAEVATEEAEAPVAEESTEEEAPVAAEVAEVEAPAAEEESAEAETASDEENKEAAVEVETTDDAAAEESDASSSDDNGDSTEE